MMQQTHIAYRELKRVNFDGDILDVKYRARVLSSPNEMDLDGQAFAAQEDVGEPRILDLRKAALLVEVEGDVTHIRLNLREREFKIVCVVIWDRIVRRELDTVVRIYGDNVGQEIGALQCEIFNNEIQLIVGVFNARDRLQEWQTLLQTSHKSQREVLTM